MRLRETYQEAREFLGHQSSVHVAAWVSLALRMAIVGSVVVVGGYGQAITVPVSQWAGFIMFALTVYISLHIADQLKRKGVLPEHAFALAAFLDWGWIIVGYVITQFSAVPFVVLLVLWLFVHGTLLSGGMLALMTILTVGGIIGAQISGFTIVGDAEFLQLGLSAQFALMSGIGIGAGFVGYQARLHAQQLDTARVLLSQVRDEQAKVLNTLPLGIFSLDEAQRVRLAWGTLANRDAVWEQVARCEDVHAALLRDAGGRGECVIDERYIEWHVLGGLRDGQMVVLRDRTDQRQIDTLMAEQSFAQETAMLASALAHEIRNPVSAVRSAAAQLVDDDLDDEDRDALEASIQRDAERLHKIAGDFLRYAKPVGAGELHALPHVVHHVLTRLQLIYPQRRVAIHLTHGADRFVHMDGTTTMLDNILGNALSLSPSGSTVYLWDEVRADGAYRLFIGDNGPGIAPERAQRIFEPFTSFRKGGTGLGLSLARRVGGQLGIDVKYLDPMTVENPYHVTGAIFALTWRV